MAAFPDLLAEALIFPTASESAYAGWDILSFLLDRLTQHRSRSAALQTPILLIGFSAGVVGAATLASLWQGLGGRIVALIAFDGWGVPLWCSFPVHRLSHDPFTHWSSALLGAGKTSFYASPAVDHLDLWRTPQTVQGWGQLKSQDAYSSGTAAQFISQWLAAYQIPSSS